MKKKLVKVFVVMLSSIILFTGIAPSFASAQSTTKPINSSDKTFPIHRPIPKETQPLNPGISKPVRGAGGGYETANIVSSLARKLAVQTLRRSAPFIESQLAKVIGKKYAKKAGKALHKVANYIETVQNVQEKGIALIFIAAGVPPDIAWMAARWIVLYFGL